MPRRPASSLEVMQAASPDAPRPDAPYFLKDDEAAIWRQIVNSVTADYFIPAHYELLALTCQHVIEARRLKHEMSLELAKKRRSAKSQKRYDQLARDWRIESNEVVKGLRQMRLTHQAVWHAETSAGRQRAQNKQSAVDTFWEDNEAAE